MVIFDIASLFLEIHSEIFRGKGVTCISWDRGKTRERGKEIENDKQEAHVTKCQLTSRESGWRVPRNSLYYFGNFP